MSILHIADGNDSVSLVIIKMVHPLPLSVRTMHVYVVFKDLHPTTWPLGLQSGIQLGAQGTGQNHVVGLLVASSVLDQFW